MRAVTATAFGDPSVLTMAELATPEPGRGEVLVRVAGAGVGPWDTKARRGAFGTRKFPYVPGAEVSGIVAALGEGVGGFQIGDAVFGSQPQPGGYAEQAVLQVARMAAAPATLDLVDAAAVPIGAGTALEGLDDHLRLQPGERLLVAGAAGGVGSFVVQLAKARGASVVATASPANNAYLRDIGADEVLDYHGDWVSAAAGVDAAYDCVGGTTWEGCVAALRDGGRAVSIAAFGSPVTRSGVELSVFSARLDGAALAEVAALIDAGNVRVEIAARLPIEDAARAHELVETGHTRGKIVLVPTGRSGEADAPPTALSASAPAG